MDQNKIQERKQLNGKVMNVAISLVLFVLGRVTGAGAEFSDIQTFLYRWRDTKWDLICSSWGITFWHSFFFFFLQETTGNLCQCHQRYILVTLTTVTLYPAKRVIAGNQWDAQLTSTGQIFQAAATLAGLLAMLSGHISAKWFWENAGSDATDQ